MSAFAQHRSAIYIALAVLGGAAATGAAFAGWADHGLDIFATMASTGLSWCL